MTPADEWAELEARVLERLAGCKRDARKRARAGGDYEATLESMLETATVPSLPLKQILKLIEAARQSDGVREGVVVVPREPTREMWAASGDAVVTLQHRGVGNHDKISEAVWSAMIAPAPHQATSTEDGK